MLIMSDSMQLLLRMGLLPDNCTLSLALMQEKRDVCASWLVIFLRACVVANGIGRAYVYQNSYLIIDNSPAFCLVYYYENNNDNRYL
jgi:hypothetical protein